MRLPRQLKCSINVLQQQSIDSLVVSRYTNTRRTRCLILTSDVDCLIENRNSNTRRARYLIFTNGVHSWLKVGTQTRDEEKMVEERVEFQG